MTLSRLIARPLLAAGFIYGGVNALKNSDKLTPAAAPVTDKVVPAARNAGIPLPEDTQTLIRINAAAQILGGLALATGKAPRLGATVLAASLVPTTIAGHAFWAESTPEGTAAQRLQFVKNLSMLGGAIIAAGDTDGSPSLVWRAKRAGRDASREAKHLAKGARRETKSLAKAARNEAKLAKAKVG